ncbi:ABC transporter permease [Paenibacillus polymyxa]|uniref:ABC transporter permease n=1 Tax=Paenibacillus polymyxa TaxID=1406 RepID=UPI0025B6E9AC|nr:ABC transporter permease [Paenibacillus polymyxa]MDN4107009.1 ABC transporter permease [Paenibacillus polymyxa]
MKITTRNSTLWVTILYLLLSLIVISFGYYQVKHKELNILSRSLYNENSISFTVDSHEEPLDWSKIDTSQSYTIFSELETIKFKNEIQDIRAIYFKNDTNLPPMVSGRFFNSTDFYSNKKIAVVGKNVDKTNIKIQNNKSYYNYHGRDFEIIGTMGAEYPSKLDNTVLLNIDGVDFKNSLQSKIYVLNINKNPITPEGIMKFKDSTLSVNVFDRGNSGSTRILNMDVLQALTLIFIILILICSSFIFAFYWIKTKKTEILILWQSGIKTDQIFKRFAMSFFLITFICYLAVCLISFLFLILNTSSNFNELLRYAFEFFKGYIIILLPSALSVWISFKKTIEQITLKGYLDK